MTDHVGVGKIKDDKLVTKVNTIQDRFGDPGGRHLGVGGKLFGFEGGNKKEFFSLAFGLATAIEKVGDMGVFFGFGDVELADLVLTEDVRESISDWWRGKSDFDGQSNFVGSHGNHGKFLGVAETFEAVESGQTQSFGNLTGAVFAKVGDNDGIVVLETYGWEFTFNDMSGGLSQ